MSTLFLLKDDPSRIRPPVADGRDHQTQGPTRIRCPRCGWEPGPHERWTCTCFHMWNTFETRGVCPACGQQWAETQCPRCHAWSPHEDWYVDERGSSS